MDHVMMRILVSGLLLVSAGCNPFRNGYFNYDKSIDFTQYKTFAWAPDSSTVEDKEFDTDIVRNNAKNYINHSLSQRGYLVNIDSPDVVFQLILLNEEKERIVRHYYSDFYSGYYFYNPYYFPYYYPRYRYYTWYGWGYPPFWDHPFTQHRERYLEETVTLNMFDRKQRKLVWTATVEGNIYDPYYIHYDVHPAIEQIMKKFPVSPVYKKSKDGGFPRNNRVDRYDEVYREINNLPAPK